MIISLCVQTQAKASDTTDIRISRNALYVQVGGKASERSLHFERVFQRGEKWNYSYGAGFSMFNKNVSIPFSFNAITTATRHHLELMLAVIPYLERHMIDAEKNLYDNDKQLYIRPSLGYRYQKKGSGLVVKAGIGPQLFIDPPSSGFWNFTPRIIRPSAHFAVGFHF